MLPTSETVIFQNPDDEQIFRELKLIPGTVPRARVNGCGVDLDAFPPKPIPEAPVFLMLGRLVADKSVGEHL